MDEMKSTSMYQLMKLQYKRVLLGVLFMTFGVGIQLLSPWVMKILVDQAIPQKKQTLLYGLILILALSPFLVTSLGAIRNQMTHYIGGYVTDQFRRLIFRKLTRLSPTTYYQFRSGEIANRIYSCGEIGDSLISQTIVPAIFDTCMLVGITGVMFYMNWKMTIVILFMLPILYILTQIFTNKARPKIDQIIQMQQELSGYSTEFVSGLKTVQKFNQAEREHEYQDHWINKYRKLRNRAAFFDNFTTLIVDFGRALGLGIVFSYGAIQIMKGHMTVGSLIAFSVYFPQMFGSLQEVQTAYMRTELTKPKVKLIYEILQLPDEIVYLPREHSQVEGKIKFDQVSFSYDDGRGEISDMSFTILPGEFIGIVGPTGSGKSTLLDLIMRFYQPQKGRIFLDGKDIASYSYEDLRSQIGLVSQDVFLWNQSILYNLKYANPEATEKEIKMCCEKAQILEFIQELPDGFDTIIGERGVKLSGGEKQRLGIAQVLLRKPQILLMDEPTSALDANTEALLQRQLKNIFLGKTVLVVAHRLATVRDADRIFVLKDGRLIEMGTHEELMKNQSLYYRLFNEQYKEK
ncbi:ATP-binding cassette, subfamily B [Seinonella peptonophila]|uniref:ATP-binding cassette, subfamily B n=1 Tax=Seinonella peptonophila TaxID=112248 RepID=A0A1M5AW44_9BACL|nr:ABC transporter ATP-binding protein [Seinonella peptonophila]SHF34468.1 ATP-binding cassette, subfamily B [Seinonella peptonophila]